MNLAAQVEPQKANTRRTKKLPMRRLRSVRKESRKVPKPPPPSPNLTRTMKMPSFAVFVAIKRTREVVL